jgi:hypothetical protein
MIYFFISILRVLLEEKKMNYYTSYQWDLNIYLIKLDVLDSDAFNTKSSSNTKSNDGFLKFKVSSIEKTAISKIFTKKPRVYINEMGLPPYAPINYKVGEEFDSDYYTQIYNSRLKAFFGVLYSPYELLFYTRSGKYFNYNPRCVDFDDNIISVKRLIIWKNGVITKYRYWKNGSRNLMMERNFWSTIDFERKTEISHKLRHFDDDEFLLGCNKKEIRKFYKFNGDKISTDDELLSDCRHRWTFKYILKQMKKKPSITILKNSKLIRIYPFKKINKKIKII